MFFTSWRCIIEAGGEVQVSWGCIQEWWKARRRIGYSIRQSKFCYASFAPSVVLKRELLRKAKLSIFVPIFTNGHKAWIMTERVQASESQMQASETRKIKGVTTFDKHRNAFVFLLCDSWIFRYRVILESSNKTAIRESLYIESLLLRIERSQLRWFGGFGHLSRMPRERLPKQTLYAAKVSGKRSVGKPRTRWLNYIEDLGWNRFGLYPSEMLSMLVDREVWRLNLELPPPQPSEKSGWKKKDFILNQSLGYEEPRGFYTAFIDCRNY